jgi:Protein of unknown function (DUF4231)
MATNKSRRPRWYSNLFFLRRRPYLWGIPLDWERPQDSGSFVSSQLWQDGELRHHPIIAQDASDLAEYLLPSFFQFSQKSKYFQNRFYLYQWVFVIGAFLTTVFGALAALLYVPPNLSVAATAAVERSVDLSAINWQQIMSYATAAIGALTAFFTALSNRGEPQKRWGKTRRLAEELRMHYFTYLSHLPPYDTPDRLRLLRENVINIRVKEQENG